MQKRENIRLYLYSRLDAQWSELLNIYLARAENVEIVGDLRDADFTVLHFADVANKTTDFFEKRKFIVLTFGDLPAAMLGLRPEDGQFRIVTKRDGAEFFYLHGEVEPKCADDELKIAASKYKMDRLHTDTHMKVLTLPLGYCSGSKINLFYHDSDKSSYFIDNCKKNPKHYEYDWCWIGADSSQDRGRLFDVLNGVNGKHKYVINPVIVAPREERTRLLNADNKPVPYKEYLDIHRKSKVCISANGIGMWNYKDGEFFANNCFVLRQFHKNLELNPFTPKDGVHWAVFQTDQVAEAIEYYSQQDDERERINDSGHEYFKRSINGGWANAYAGMFLDYLNGDSESFRKVEYRV